MSCVVCRRAPRSLSRALFSPATRDAEAWRAMPYLPRNRLLGEELRRIRHPELCGESGIRRYRKISTLKVPMWYIRKLILENTEWSWNWKSFWRFGCALA